MKTRKVKVPATTNNITTGIINRLLVDGHSASRINTQGQFMPVCPGPRGMESTIVRLKAMGYTVGRYQKSGARVGVADVLACMRPSGSFLAIEIKNELTKDKQSPDQKAFAEEITKAGGDYWIVTSYAEFVKRYESSRWSF